VREVVLASWRGGHTYPRKDAGHRTRS
jgi:hypothetical protein